MQVVVQFLSWHLIRRDLATCFWLELGHKGLSFWLDLHLVSAHVLLALSYSPGHSESSFSFMLAEMRIMIRLLRVLSSQVLKASKDGDGTSSLVNLFHCLTALMIKGSFFHPVWILFHIMPVSLVITPCMVYSMKSPAPLSVGKLVLEAVSYPDWISPVLCFSPLGNWSRSQPAWCLSAAVYLCLSQNRGSRTGHKL